MKKQGLPTLKEIILHNRKEREKKREKSRERTEAFRKKIKEY